MNNLCQLSQSQLMDVINKTSFAVNDIQLFLDSHHDCAEALAYFHEHNQLRNAALKESLGMDSWKMALGRGTMLNVEL